MDKRGKLDEEIFSYQATKDGKVFIFWNGKQEIILKGKSAAKFLANITAADHTEAQLLMAKATGHFKHGNKRKNK